MTIQFPYAHLKPKDEPVISNLADYPVNALPQLLREVTLGLHSDNQIPLEMIASTTLSAISLACLPLIKVIPPHTNEPEHCSLYFLTIAESGEGKTTIFKPIMKPFYEFSLEMKREYQQQLVEYAKKLDLWSTIKRALNSRLRKAVNNDNNRQAAEDAITTHAESEPQKPKYLNMLYEDATPKTLIQGLSDYPFAAVISDEAITFFHGYAKNNLGLLNRLWGGETYVQQRPDGESLEIRANLVLSLMVQSGVFVSYLKKHGDVAESSGFISRFMFTKTLSTLGHRNQNVTYEKSNSAVEKFQAAIRVLLERQKSQFYNNSHEKKTLRLSEEAALLCRTNRSNIELMIASGGQWEHIKPIASKAGSNAIRLAAIFHYITDEQSNEITLNTLKCAFAVIKWHLDQASTLFYPMSDNFNFEQDVYALFSWIKNRFENTGNLPFKKNEIEKYGPNKLRRVEKLTPVLDQLISMGLICTFKRAGNPALYIAMSLDNGATYMGILPFEKWVISIVSSWENTLGKQIKIDNTKLQWSNSSGV